LFLLNFHLHFYKKKPAMKIKVLYNNLNDGGVVKFPMM
jgi:hypothetical protein